MSVTVFILFFLFQRHARQQVQFKHGAYGNEILPPLLAGFLLFLFFNRCHDQHPFLISFALERIGR